MNQNFEATNPFNLTRPGNLTRISEHFSIMASQSAFEQLEHVFAAMPAGVIILDGAGCVSRFNPAAQVLFPKLEIGLLWRGSIADFFAPRWDDGHDISLHNGRRVNISTQSLEGGPGQILLFTDVTENRRLQEQLDCHRRLSAKGEMAAALAHQIRTPLASAILYLSNLSNADLSADLSRRFLTKSMNSLQALERLVGEMLLFARGGAFSTKVVLLAEIFKELEHQLAATISAQGFTLDIQRPPADIWINANSDALGSAMANLVNNAVKACGEGGIMKIQIQARSPKIIEIRFCDNGPGILEQDRDAIFEPFFSNSSGSGLGLPVARMVVRSHGGDLILSASSTEGTVEGSAQGTAQGTEFIVSLPVLTQHERDAFNNREAVPVENQLI